MLRKARPVVRMLLLALVVACGGSDGPSAGNSIAPKAGSLTVTIAEVPSGATASVTVAGPNGFRPHHRWYHNDLRTNAWELYSLSRRDLD